MRLLILMPLLLLPFTGCMTQRDQTLWQEFKAEISGDKTEVKSEAAPAPVAPVDKVQE
ncbi:MAG TPA: hypothetical protein VE954_28065 [Oligoflexus sp.]|uniref:hypothetical protein n=1 Tax=Oligoflexus sp. TaxID=1971216 RepID=UPI002D3F8B7C|nr:hypothetical protein [Oligoflexus sp.]HYX36974.1 hypothetical protein [Oligoflexus sp.]